MALCVSVCAVYWPSGADYLAWCKKWWQHKMTSSSHGSADKPHTKLCQCRNKGQTQIAHGTEEEKHSDTEAGLGSQLNNAALWLQPHSKCENWSHADLESVPVAWWIILISETRQAWDSTVAPSNTALPPNSTFGHPGKTTKTALSVFSSDRHTFSCGKLKNGQSALYKDKQNIFLCCSATMMWAIIL